MEDLIEFLQKMVCLIGFGRKCSWDIVGKNIKKNKNKIKKGWVNTGLVESCIFKCWQFVNVRSELYNPEYFVKGSNKTFQMHWNILPKLGLLFSVLSKKYIKWAISDILMSITLGVNITRRMTSFFSSTIQALYVDIFHFCISKT